MVANHIGSTEPIFPAGMKSLSAHENDLSLSRLPDGAATRMCQLGWT